VFPRGRWRQGFLSIFGPLSLFALVVLWAAGLITGFGLLYWSQSMASTNTDGRLLDYFYFSGATFFTLGYGDLVPTAPFGRAVSVAEAGLGFVFLAVIVSYVPVLYQAFSRREIAIALLDARAGSPPCAGELLRRLGGANLDRVDQFLVEWEAWSAELLESHLSFPLLSYYRSQHGNQSWVAALTMILDTSSVLVADIDAAHNYQARLTFAAARHAAVDLSLMVLTRPPSLAFERLPYADHLRLRELLRHANLPLRESSESRSALAELRGLYEPFVTGLATHFEFELPPFRRAEPPVDNWQTSAWQPRSPGFSGLADGGTEDDHFG
jgi:hypothetical protein